MKLRYLVIFMLMFTLAGCAKKLTRENFDLVQERSYTTEDVERTLGKPQTRTHILWQYQIPKKHIIVHIHFDENNRVVSKDWIDGRTGEWKQGESDAQ